MQHEKIVIQCNAPDLGADLAHALDAKLLVADGIRFADTEVDIVLNQPYHAVAGKEVLLIAQFGGQLASWPINDFLLSLCFLAHRIRAAGALSLRCVLPYFPYARQDLHATHGGVSSARILCDLMKTAGIDECIVFDIHNNHLVEQSTFTLTNIECQNFWLGVLRLYMNQLGNNKYVLVAPDASAAVRVQALANELGIEACFITKQRTHINQATAIALSGNVLGRYALILDDIIDTGRTAVSAADLVLSHGAVGVSGFFTHGVLSSASLAVMQFAPFDHLVVADTLQQSILRYDAMHYVSMRQFIVDSVTQLIIKSHHRESSQQKFYEPTI